MTRQRHVWRDSAGRERFVSVLTQAQWGSWVQAVIERGPERGSPEGPRMSDTGDPPQDGVDESKMTPAQRAAWRVRGLFDDQDGET